MKKLLLLSLLVMPHLSASQWDFKTKGYVNRLKEVISDAKELVMEHPYVSVTLGVATLAAIYWYTKSDDTEDPSWANYEAYENGERRPVGWYKIQRPDGFMGTKTPSPEASPSSTLRSSPDFKDYTGEFTPRARSNLHATELRHK